jgi:major membrane immunogen (membrane-anchored lipoprotein)
VSKNNFKPYKISVSIFTVFIIASSILLTGCIFSDESKEKVKDKAAEVIGDAAEYAGEMTANWIGTTTANIGKNYNEAVVKRMAYLDITVEKVESKIRDDKRKLYKLELMVNNPAPANEKMYYHILLDDNYLVACNGDDYTYSLTLYDNGYDDDSIDEDDEDYDDDSYNDMINPGKSRIVAYTELPAEEAISYLQFIDKKISLP